MTAVRALVERVVWVRIAQLIVNERYREGAFKIPIHLALGHEALAVALNEALNPNDRLLLSHRNIAYNLARQRSLKPILDEYRLKKTGLAGGRLGSMNLANPRRGIPYASSILGNNFAVGCGVALALKQKGSGIAFVLGGDGSIEEGTFYESLVFAKSQEAPLVFLIEDNEWSMSTHVKERRAPIHLAQLAKSLGTPYMKLSGNEVESYVQSFKKAKLMAREGPVLIEARVHTLGDWRKEELGSKRFINYHAGPAPKISFDGSTAIIKREIADPVFVMERKIGHEQMEKITRRERARIEQEL